MERLVTTAIAAATNGTTTGNGTGTYDPPSSPSYYEGLGVGNSLVLLAVIVLLPVGAMSWALLRHWMRTRNVHWGGCRCCGRRWGGGLREKQRLRNAHGDYVPLSDRPTEEEKGGGKSADTSLVVTA